MRGQCDERPKEAVKKADIIYTDVWASMGKEKEREERLKILKPYQVNRSWSKGLMRIIYSCTVFLPIGGKR